jgi:hypothetical protein
MGLLDRRSGLAVIFIPAVDRCGDRLSMAVWCDLCHAPHGANKSLARATSCWASLITEQTHYRINIVSPAPTIIPSAYFQPAR